MAGRAVLEARGIRKQFPRSGVVALNDVDFDLQEGEIHALVGENGAGKTTLGHVACGSLKTDRGTVKSSGLIGMVPQHPILVDTLTVAENVVLGAEPLRVGMLLDTRYAVKYLITTFGELGLEINPNSLGRDIPLGQRQWINLIKCLFRGCRILILDEPTAVLTPQEAKQLFAVMRSFVQKGGAIIFISHKLPEIYEVADRITVLRQGKVVGRGTPSEIPPQRLVTMMVGQEVDDNGSGNGSRLPLREQLILEVNELQVRGDDDRLAVKGVSFTVFAGEIFGVVGIQAGQRELVEAIAGLREIGHGQVAILERSVRGMTRSQILEIAGHIPENRQGSLVLDLPVAANMMLTSYCRPPFLRHGLINGHAARDHAEYLIGRYGIVAKDPAVPVRTLSGGNQQKIIVARETVRSVNLLLACEPTAGLDILATSRTHKAIRDLRNNGCAILLVTSDLEEALTLSDRIMVMFRGESRGVLDAEDATRERIGTMMAGG